MSLIQVSNLTFAYEGSYDPIFENVSFQIDTNWRLGFTGRNGRGKTTFLNLLLGRFPYRGSISASGYRVLRVDCENTIQCSNYSPNKSPETQTAEETPWRRK